MYERKENDRHAKSCFVNEREMSECTTKMLKDSVERYNRKKYLCDKNLVFHNKKKIRHKNVSYFVNLYQIKSCQK
jgi:hypothetical protein